MSPDKSLTYKDAGVDIDAGNELVERIKPHVGSTRRPGVLGSIGGFGGLFELDLDKYPRPVLVSGTDGVGTKLKLAIELGRYDTVGIDLVAMCVNDIVVQGAEPLFFLDYYATGQLDVEVGAAIVGGIAEGCRQAGAALIGGETAEMPGMYAAGDFDLAGFAVGIVDRSRIVDGSSLSAGDRLLGLASTGPHSNGFSLIRKILANLPDGGATERDGQSVGATLLEPTRIYVRSLLALLESCPVGAMAHITGGGLPDNVVRVLPAHLDAVIDASAWERPPLFDWLQQHGGIADAEMLRTFNCGIGMVVAVPATAVDRAGEILAAHGETVYPIGALEAGSGRVRID